VSYSIEFLKSAAKEFKKLPKLIQSKTINTLKMVEVDPYSEVLKMRKIRGKENLFRIRIGDYRLIYAIENSCIVIVRIRHRKNVYDNL
jgi:mRNA interferase RelE/StbE